MYSDCHIHMLLDGRDWRAAIDRHRGAPDEAWIRQRLEDYRSQGFTYLRDGGDRWGAGALASRLAGEYGITYRTPLAPICRSGHYGGFIGKKYSTLAEYRALVEDTRKQGGHFIKVMLSGIMDFDAFGVLTEEGLPPQEIRELVAIAHGEGFSVMAHCNGPRTMEAAAAAGVDSIEHGAYADTAALEAMAACGAVWVPTLSAIGNLRGRGRFREEAVSAILASSMAGLRQFAALGGLIAPGSDAGAWAVPHAGLTEYALLEEALGPRTPELLEAGVRAVREKF